MPLTRLLEQSAFFISNPVCEQAQAAGCKLIGLFAACEVPSRSPTGIFFLSSLVISPR